MVSSLSPIALLQLMDIFLLCIEFQELRKVHQLFCFSMVLKIAQHNGLSIQQKRLQPFNLLELDLMCGWETTEEITILINTLLLATNLKNIGTLTLKIWELLINQLSWITSLKQQDRRNLPTSVILKELPRCSSDQACFQNTSMVKLIISLLLLQL